MFLDHFTIVFNVLIYFVNRKSSFNFGKSWLCDQFKEKINIKMKYVKHLLHYHYHIMIVVKYLANLFNVDSQNVTLILIIVLIFFFTLNSYVEIKTHK